MLADGIDVVGSLGRTGRAAAHRQEMTRLAQITTDLVVHIRFVTGCDVLTWSELHTRVTPAIPIAHWSHIQDGKLTRIRMVFDAHPFTAIGWADRPGRSTRRRRPADELLGSLLSLSNP